MNNTYRVFAFSEDVISIYNESNKNQNFKLNDNIDKNFDTVIIFLAERNQKTLDVKFFKNGKMLFIGASYSYGEYPIFEYPIQLAGATQPEQKEETFRVGDRVYDWLHGWMTINEVKSHGSIILVDDNDFQEHTFNGNNIERLSFTEYNFVTGGWSQERPKPLPKVGDIGWFWRTENDIEIKSCFYGEITKIKEHDIYCYRLTDEMWFKYFSIEKPF